MVCTFENYYFLVRIKLGYLRYYRTYWENQYALLVERETLSDSEVVH